MRTLKDLTKSVLFAALVLCLVSTVARLVGAASNDPRPANEFVVGYATDTTSSAFRTMGGLADTTVIATLTSGTTTRYTINGKPTIQLEAVFSSTSQTCVAGILWEYRNYAGTLQFTRWSSFQTLTGTSKPGPGDSGYMTSPGYSFNTGGATHCRVVCTTVPTTGTVAFYPVSY